MSDILGPVITSRAFQGASFVIGLLCFIFAVSLLMWLYRDAYRRGTAASVWTVIGVVAGIAAALAGFAFSKYGFGPVGALALIAVLIVVAIYTFLRPEDYLGDMREQQLALALLEAQIDKDTCPTCVHGIESTFLVCPYCNTTLRVPCDYCGKPIKPEWMLCPYCKSNQRLRTGETTNRLPVSQDVEKEKDDPVKPPRKKATRKQSASSPTG